MCPDSPDGKHNDTQGEDRNGTWLQCSYCGRTTGYTPKTPKR